MYMSSGFGLMFSAIPFFMIIISVFAIGVFIVAAIRGVGKWNENNHSPVLTVQAEVAAKRTEVKGGVMHHNHDNAIDMRSTAATYYYATFEIESGDRIELHISGDEYGMLAEGDRGSLTFQGTRFKSFERTKSENLLKNS